MLAIAVLAGVFAVCGVKDGIGVLIVVSAVFLPIVMASPARRWQIAAWVGSLYPLLLLAFLHATWLTAWCVLGHRPRVSLDDPKHIGPIVDVLIISTTTLMAGLLTFALPLGAYLVFAHILLSVRSEGCRPLNVAAQLIVPLCLWLSPLAIVGLMHLFGFEDVIAWFMAGLFGN